MAVIREMSRISVEFGRYSRAVAHGDGKMEKFSGKSPCLPTTYCRRATDEHRKTDLSRMSPRSVTTYARAAALLCAGGSIK